MVGRHFISLFFLSIVLLALSSCGATTRNVRAFRAYANEDPDLGVSLDRIEDLSQSLDLIDRLLRKTPYAPGDKWVAKLGLTDAQAARIKTKVQGQPPYDSGNYEVPVVKLYRLHLEQVLADAEKEHAADLAPSEPKPAEPPPETTPPPDVDNNADAGTPDEDAGGSPPAANGEPLPDKTTPPASKPRDPGKTLDGRKLYPSLLEAMAVLAPGAAGITQKWETFDKADLAYAAADAHYDKVYSNALDKTPQNATMSPDLRKTVDEAKELANAAEKDRDEARAQLDQAIAALGAAKASTAEQKRLAKDLMIATSVTLRVQLESLALVPIVIVQSARAVPSLATTLKRDLERYQQFKSVEQIQALPGQAENIKRRISSQVAVSQRMAEAMAGINTVDIDDTAGFSLKESVVDQIAGVTIDSFKVYARVGGEAFFFTQAQDDSSTEQSTATSSSSSNETKITHDYTGRTRRLEYHVDPILLVGGRLDAGFDFIHIPNAANLNVGFSTDRVFSSGGSVKTDTSLGKQLGLSGVASDVFDAGLGILGVKTSVKVADFTVGRVELLQVSATTGKDTGRVLGEAPLRISFTQIDVGYDISFLFPEFAHRYYIEEVRLGYRYFKYRLPRILYELRDTNTSSEYDSYVFLRQSPPQTLDSIYHMGGFVFRFGSGTAPLFAVYIDLGMYFGGGPLDYYFLEDPDGKDVERNRHYWSASVFAMDFSAGLGARLRVTPKKSRFRLNAELGYNAELVYQSISSKSPEIVDGVEQGEKQTIEYGSADVFHGPAFNIVGSF